MPLHPAVMRLLAREGGSNKTNVDTGGYTKGGIAESSGLTRAQIEAMTPRDVENYWQKKWDETPDLGNEGLREVLYDMRANIGEPRAAQYLQETVNNYLPQGEKLKVDRLLGKNTLDQARRVAPDTLATALMNRFTRHHKDLVVKNPAKYRSSAKGWANRRDALWQSPDVAPLYRLPGGQPEPLKPLAPVKPLAPITPKAQPPPTPPMKVTPQRTPMPWEVAAPTQQKLAFTPSILKPPVNSARRFLPTTPSNQPDYQQKNLPTTPTTAGDYTRNHLPTTPQPGSLLSPLWGGKWQPRTQQPGQSPSRTTFAPYTPHLRPEEWQLPISPPQPGMWQPGKSPGILLPAPAAPTQAPYRAFLNR